MNRYQSERYNLTGGRQQQKKIMEEQLRLQQHVSLVSQDYQKYVLKQNDHKDEFIKTLSSSVNRTQGMHKENLLKGQTLDYKFGYQRTQ